MHETASQSGQPPVAGGKGPSVHEDAKFFGVNPRTLSRVISGEYPHLKGLNRGVPRIEISRDVFFATDELAMRALERIDVEAMAIDAMSTLQTAAQ